jgi:hypothetical protein
MPFTQTLVSTIRLDLRDFTYCPYSTQSPFSLAALLVNVCQCPLSSTKSTIKSHLARNGHVWHDERQIVHDPLRTFMSDDLTKLRPRDATKINVHEPWELEYWCKALGVSPQQLKEAVKAVGTSVVAVKQYLGK